MILVGLTAAVIHQILLQKLNYDFRAMVASFGEMTSSATSGASDPAVQAHSVQQIPGWKVAVLFILKLPFGHFSPHSVLLGVVDSLIWGAGCAWQDRRVGKRQKEPPYV